MATAPLLLSTAAAAFTATRATPAAPREALPGLATASVDRRGRLALDGFERVPSPLAVASNRIATHTAVDRLGDPDWVSQLMNLEDMGSGASGSVYRGAIGEDGADLAIKVVEVASKSKYFSVRRELEAMRRFGGGDVVKLYGTTFTPPADDQELLTHIAMEPLVYVFMEAADSNMYDTVIKDNVANIPKDIKLRMLLQVLRGLRKMERAGYVHRDIKPDNILTFGDCLSPEGCQVKIGDLGCACPVSECTPGCSDLVGSPLYMAPEVWSGKAHVAKSDTWSAGMLAFELFVGKLPTRFTQDLWRRRPDVHNLTTGEFIPQGLDITKDRHFQRFVQADPEVGNLILAMLTKSVKRRPTIEQSYSMAKEIGKRWGVHVPEQQNTKRRLAP